MNLPDEPLSDYGLSLPASTISGEVKAAELLHDAPVKAPALDAQGGFHGDKPLAELAPRAGYVIRLSP